MLRVGFSFLFSLPFQTQMLFLWTLFFFLLREKTVAWINKRNFPRQSEKNVLKLNKVCYVKLTSSSRKWRVFQVKMAPLEFSRLSSVASIKRAQKFFYKLHAIYFILI